MSDGKARCSQSMRSQRRQVTPDGRRRVRVLEVDAVGVDQLARVLDPAAEADGLHGLLRVVAAASPCGWCGRGRSTSLPSGMRETWMRIIPGVMNAAKTFQRGHAPLKRAKRMPLSR